MGYLWALEYRFETLEIMKLRNRIERAINDLIIAKNLNNIDLLNDSTKKLIYYSQKVKLFEYLVAKKLKNQHPNQISESKKLELTILKTQKLTKRIIKN